MTKIKRTVKKFGSSSHVILPKSDFEEGMNVWITEGTSTATYPLWQSDLVDYDRIRQIVREELEEFKKDFKQLIY